MANIPQDTNSNNIEDKKKSDSLGSRLLVAGAFGTIGGKIGTIGSVIDANELLKDEAVTIGQKFKKTFDGTLLKKAFIRVDELVKSGATRQGMAWLKVMKWGTITTLVGMVAGVAIGWVRGGKIDNWKDILDHPIDSTKIVFGLEENKKSDNKQRYDFDNPDAKDGWGEYVAARPTLENVRKV